MITMLGYVTSYIWMLSSISYKIGEKIPSIDADICSIIKNIKIVVQYLQRNYISLSWFLCGSSVLVTLEFRDPLVFVEGGKPSEQGEDQQNIIDYHRAWCFGASKHIILF